MTWLGDPPRSHEAGAPGRAGFVRAAIFVLGAAIVGLGGVWLIAGPGEVGFSSSSPDSQPVDRSSTSLGNPASWVTSDDYPPEALYRGEWGTVGVTFTVDASGRATNCVVTTSSRSESLDRETCALIKRRARYIPARDAQGRAVESRKTLRFRWMLEK